MIVARPGTVLLKAGSNLQRPASSVRVFGYERARLLDQAKMGISGYDPNYDDMKGVFMAKGPGKILIHVDSAL